MAAHYRAASERDPDPGWAGSFHGSSRQLRGDQSQRQRKRFSASGYPDSQKIVCTGGTPQDAIEETVIVGSSSLSYDAASDTYTYVWKTSKAWAGTCRQLNVRLNDGTEHRANFKFVR